MSKEKEPRNEVETGAGKEQPDSGRRRFTRAGMVAPALLTLTSRPVWGWQCTMSAMLSGNASGQMDITQCEGCTPGYWGQHGFLWPAPYHAGTCNTQILNGNGKCKMNDYSNDGTKFGDYFLVAGHEFDPDDSMMQIIHKEGHCDAHQAGAHAVAALLNAASSVNYPMTEQQVIDFWNDNYLTNLQLVGDTLRDLNELGCPL